VLKSEVRYLKTWQEQDIGNSKKRKKKKRKSNEYLRIWNICYCTWYELQKWLHWWYSYSFKHWL